MNTAGSVYLVGAGPGDPDLLTMKAARLIVEADVIVHDRLVAPEILRLARFDAKRIAVGKGPRHHPVPQNEINRILVREARTGRMVVRLKGGDPFVFGRGSEEAQALRDSGIRCDIVPGITAAQGCAAATGVPLTHRGLATSVRFVTGHCREDEPLDFDGQGLADPSTTLVVYMGAASIADIAAHLTVSGLANETPVLAIANATTPREERLITRLGDVSADMAAAQLAGPVLFVIGKVVSLYACGESSSDLRVGSAQASKRVETLIDA